MELLKEIAPRTARVALLSTRLQNVRVKKGRIYRDLLARPKRFELLTPRFVVWCSIQLSYGRGAT
jgi:hypothetical protein